MLHYSASIEIDSVDRHASNEIVMLKGCPLSHRDDAIYPEDMLALIDYMKIAVSLIVVLDPIGAIPLFLAATNDQTAVQRRHTAMTAAVTVGIVLVVSIWLGEWMLMAFGIRIATFRIGGGILILLMAISMLHAKVSGAIQTADERREAQAKDEVGVVPLGIPLLAGPGAISTIIIVSHRGEGLAHRMILCGIVVAVAVGAWLTLRLGTILEPKMGRTGINIVTRLMGLILAAIAVEFIVNGLLELMPGLRGPVTAQP